MFVNFNIIGTKGLLNFQQNGKKMKKYSDVLSRCPLFAGIDANDVATMLGCLDAKENKYEKGDAILSEGDSAGYLGIVLEGAAQIERVDYFGNRSILATVKPSEIFGESFACSDISEMPVSVIAMEDTKVFLIDIRQITQSCTNACAFHSRMIFNLLNVVAGKNLVLHRKIEITSKRTTREKLMAYLLMEGKNRGSNTFTIPYNRQELADYLEVDRSGLSTEISKLQKEKIITCKRNEFSLLGEEK